MEETTTAAPPRALRLTSRWACYDAVGVIDPRVEDCMVLEASSPEAAARAYLEHGGAAVLGDDGRAVIGVFRTGPRWVPKTSRVFVSVRPSIVPVVRSGVVA